MTEVLTYEALKAERDAQQKRADALAVENAAMREALDSIRIYSSDTLSGPSDSVPDMAAWLREGVEHLHQVSTIETTTTDAALAAIRLEAKIEGANELAELIAEIHSKTAPGSNIEKKLMFAAEAAVAYANGLREAK